MKRYSTKVPLLLIWALLFCGLPVVASPAARLHRARGTTFVTSKPYLPSVVAYPTEVAAFSPTGYWRESETSGATVADSAASPHNGALSGTYTRNAPSLLTNNTADPAITYTGATFSTSAFYSSSTNVSFSALVKFSSVPSGVVNIVSIGSQGDGSGAFIFRYNRSAESLQLVTNYSGGADATGPSWIPTANATYHFVVTLNVVTGAVVIYSQGGSLYSGTTAHTPLAISSKAVVVGGITGVIDEPALFTSILSATDVKALYAASRGMDAAQTTWYADPAGTTTAVGTTGDPLDLNTLLSLSLVHPGDTIYAKDGAYTAPTAASANVGIWTAAISGTSGSRIVIRALNPGLAILNGADRGGSVLMLTGSYLDVAGFEIKKVFATRTTTLVDTSGCPITNTDGQVMAGGGINDKGSYNHAYYNYIHDVLGDGIDSFQSATNSEYYGNIIAHNGWTAPRTLGGPAEGNGHAIYAQNLGSNGQKKIEENIFFDPYSSPVAAKGSGASYVENFLIKGNVSIDASSFWDVGGGVDGINDITVDGEMLYNTEMKPGYNSSANRQVSITNSYIAGRVGGSSAAVQLLDFDAFTFTGNETLRLSNSPGAGILEYRIRTGHTYSESTVNNNQYWQVWTGSTTPAFYALGTGVTPTTSSFATYKTATGWDASSTYNNPSPNNWAIPTVNKLFTRATSRYEAAGRCNVVAYNWAGSATISRDLSSCGFVDGQAYSIYNGMNPGTAVATGTYSAASPTVTFTISTTVSTRYGDAGNSPAGTTQFNVFQVVGGAGSVSAPNPPSSFTGAWAFASQGQPGNVTLAWVVNTSGAATIVEKSTDGTNYSSVTTTAADATSYTVTGLTSALTYFRIRATKAGLESTNQGPVTEKPTPIRCYAATCTR